MIFLPHLSLALEYQGGQHYTTLSNFGDSEIWKRRDQAKLNFASQVGITLISIPFWWDRSSDSLAATIQLKRPDLISSTNGVAIPLEMPLRFKKYQKDK
jgi:hypothetical protein